MPNNMNKIIIYIKKMMNKLFHRQNYTINKKYNSDGSWIKKVEKEKSITETRSDGYKKAIKFYDKNKKYVALIKDNNGVVERRTYHENREPKSVELIVDKIIKNKLEWTKYGKLIFSQDRFGVKVDKRKENKKTMEYGGFIKDFPQDIVEALLFEQERQGNKRNVSVFENIKPIEIKIIDDFVQSKNNIANKEEGGFNWNQSSDNVQSPFRKGVISDEKVIANKIMFWYLIIVEKQFKLFYIDYKLNYYIDKL